MSIYIIYFLDGLSDRLINLVHVSFRNEYPSEILFEIYFTKF